MMDFHNRKTFLKDLLKEKLLPNIFGQVDLKYLSGKVATQILVNSFCQTVRYKEEKIFQSFQHISAELLSLRRLDQSPLSLYVSAGLQMILFIIKIF